MAPKRKGIWPALALFCLAPIIGELLSGSSPPAEFFHPFGLLVMDALVAKSRSGLTGDPASMA